MSTCAVQRFRAFLGRHQHLLVGLATTYERREMALQLLCLDQWWGSESTESNGSATNRLAMPVAVAEIVWYRMRTLLDSGHQQCAVLPRWGNRSLLSD